jgi:hypothetical protein
MSKTDWEDIAGPEGHLKSQGFYLYRGRAADPSRHMVRSVPAIRTDQAVPGQDRHPQQHGRDWKIDVKKSSAQLPPIVRDRLKKVIERIQDGSKRTYRKRGQKLVDHERLPMWHRIQADGQIRYRPNVGSSRLRRFRRKPAAGSPARVSSTALRWSVRPCRSKPCTPTWRERPSRSCRTGWTRTRWSRPSVDAHRAHGARKDIKEIMALMKDVDPFRSAWEDTQRIIAARSRRRNSNEAPPEQPRRHDVDVHGVATGPHTAQSIRDIIAQLREHADVRGEGRGRRRRGTGAPHRGEVRHQHGLGAIVDAEDFRPWLHDAGSMARSVTSTGAGTAGC